MSLNSTAIKSFKAQSKPVKYFDERGLYIQVNPNGKKWWRFKYRFEGKEKLISLGTYPDVGLALARDKRDELRKKVVNKCKSCHSIKQEKNKLGPHLVKIFGRKAGSIENFKYSSALKDSGIIWSEETLKGYLANPRKYIPGTKMSFAGIKNTDQLNHLIEYLKKDSN